MAQAIEMPKPGVTVEECLLVKWVKQAGDAVSEGDLVAEIEADKATFEITAPAAGQLLATFFKEGELVPVYSNLCVIGQPGEDAEAFRPAAARPAAEAAPLKHAAVEERDDTPDAVSSSSGASVFASPRARRWAEERRFPIAGLAGSGPNGRILEADVQRAYYSDNRAAFAAAAPTPAPLTPVPAAKRMGIRERIAQRMRDSLATTAQYTLHTSASAAALLAARARIKAAKRDVDVNLNELVMFATVEALRRVPELNAEYINGELVKHDQVHLGFAADTPRGLLVPVLRDCAGLPLDEFARRVKTLGAQAAEGKISPDDLTGATFTVSNLGSMGIEFFTPILNPPQVGILGVNAIRLEPVRANGAVEFQDRIGLSLTLDHQVIDGAPGVRFLQVLRESIERISEQ